MDFLNAFFLFCNSQETVVLVNPRASDADHVVESDLVKDLRLSIQVDLLLSFNIIQI